MFMPSSSERTNRTFGENEHIMFRAETYSVNSLKKKFPILSTVLELTGAIAQKSILHA